MPAPDKKQHEELLETARERFRIAKEAEDRIRPDMIDDLKFSVGEQWPENIKAQRKADNKPCITINKQPQFIHQITNEVRRNKPAPSTRPVDDKGDPETAEIINGIIRHIHRNSKADAVRSYASEYQVRTGRGYYRIVTDYCNDEADGPEMFDQDIYIRRIKNPFSVYFDPACQEPDYSDAAFAFVITRIRREDFKRDYPNAETATDASAFDILGEQAPDWHDDDTVQIAEYFYVEHERQRVALLSTGESVPADQVPEGAEVIAQRSKATRRVKWAKITGVEVLEQADWPGKWIPIIPVLGEELDVNGKTVITGLVRNGKGAQEGVNYMTTAAVETIALAPRAPFIGAEGQFEGHPEWAQANIRNFAFLEYKPVSLGGQLAPPPQRQTFEPAIQGFVQMMQVFNEAQKASHGMYDPSLGARSNETSGKAILARKAEGDTANYHFADHLEIAENHETRILLDLIPKIYDRPGRVARIIGDEEEEKTVVLNQPFEEKPGIRRLFDLSVGRYDVAVSIGPSYSTKRTEAAESMLALAQAHPPLMQAAGDLMVQSMDWPGAQTIAERLKKLLPPELQEQDDQKQQPLPPQIQQQLAQQGQAIEQLTAALNDATSQERLKKLELESREKIAAMQVQAEVLKTLAQLDSRESLTLLQAELSAIRDTIQNVAAVETEQVPAGQPAAAA